MSKCWLTLEGLSIVRMSSWKRQRHSVDLGDLEQKPKKTSSYAKILRNANLSLASGFRISGMTTVDLNSSDGLANGVDCIL